MLTTSASEREDAALAFFAKPIGALAPEKATAIKDGVCTMCQGEALEFRDALSKREWSISGLCQGCQDEVFGGEE